MTSSTQFQIDYHAHLSADGKLTKSGEKIALAKDFGTLKSLYEDMHFLRALDKKAYAMQRTGKMGTYPASTGQEAIGTGFGHFLTEKDVLVPYYRGTGSMLKHGVTACEILQFWGGDERGSHFQHAKKDFPICIPIATQCLHAAGVAKAINYRNPKKPGAVVVTEIGEGGTSKGDFYESLNVAGAWNLPLVTFINNNQWAISVPSELQTATKTYAQKAIAAGIEGIQVDGNDILAVSEVAKYAFDKARNGGGATLIEAITYRLCDHTTADDATRYVDKKDIDTAWKNEPLVRLKQYLLDHQVIDEKADTKIIDDATQKAARAADEFLSVEKPSPTEMFDHLYDTLPPHIARERELLAR